MPKVIRHPCKMSVECCVFGLYGTEEEIIRRMDECGVDATYSRSPFLVPEIMLHRHGRDCGVVCYTCKLYVGCDGALRWNDASRN